MQTAEPQRLSLRVVCFILLAPSFALVACAPIVSTPEKTPRAGAGNPKNRGPVVTVSRVVDGDTVEVTPAMDDLTQVRLIGVDTPETSHYLRAAALRAAAGQGVRRARFQEAQRTAKEANRGLWGL